MSKISILQSRMPDTMDAILITSDISRRYLTGFNYTDGYVLVTHKSAVMFADFRYIEAARPFASDELEVVMLKGRRSSQLGDTFRDLNLVHVGFEDVSLTYAEGMRLKADFPTIDWLPIGTLLDDQREVKDEGEIAKITAAQRIAEKGFEYLLGFIRPDMTEREVALELEFFMRKNGAEASAFDIIAVSGSASSMPHGVPRDVVLEKGFLTLDFGAVVDGYLSDMTRTIVLGKADEEMKRVYQTVLDAQLAALEVIAAGKPGDECDKAARDLIDGAGYEGCFGHSLGHGVGMYIHEAPSLSGGWKKPLVPGQIVTVEPGIYIEGKYGVRIEDMVVVREGGNENLTRAPKQMIEIF